MDLLREKIPMSMQIKMFDDLKMSKLGFKHAKKRVS